MKNTEDQKKSILEFATVELNQGLIERDKIGQFNQRAWKAVSTFGLHGLPVPQEYGGRGKDLLEVVSTLEDFGYACRDNGFNFALNAHLWGCVMPLLEFGTEEQKKNYLPKLCSGEWIGGVAMTERESGSNAYGLNTTAEKRGDVYVLNGDKTWITNASIADAIIVFANVDKSRGSFGITGFLVEKGTPGLSINPDMPRMGLRTVPVGELLFENCAVPASNIMGAEGGGLALFNNAMEWERGFLFACPVGAMQRQLDMCVHYAGKRHQFGQPIGKFQQVSSKIVDMRLRLENAKLLLRKVASLKQQGESITMQSAMTKLYISEAWVQSSQDAIQIHGGYGYLTESGLERDLRDATGSRIHSGTSEIQKLIIADFIGL